MYKSILILSFLLLPTPTLASDHPNLQGCYESNWFYPWLNTPGVNCTHPALGDPDHTTPIIHIEPKPHEPPPHECHYINKE